MGLKHCPQKRLLSIAGTDNPGCDAVDGGVEEVKADEHLVQCIVADDLLHDLLEFVLKNNDVVGIPAHSAGDVERDLVKVAQQGRNLVADPLGGMIVTVVQEVVDAGMGCCITHVKLVGADRIAFQTDAEDLALHAVDDIGHGFGKDFVQCTLQS